MKNRGWIVAAALTAILFQANAASAQWQDVFKLGAPLRGWPQDQGGVLFVQEAGTNPPPGNPASPAVNQQADDDYYTAGTYPAPIGTVPEENVSERAFAGTDNDLRFHFNLPTTLTNADKFRFSFEPFNLHTDGIPDPRYGIEVSFNGVLVQPELVITPNELNTVITTAEFTAGAVGALAGPGGDNIVALRGINYNNEGGGNWMGLDYHHLEMMPVPEPGAFGMMFTGLMWSLPVICFERAKGRKKKA